MSKETSSAHTLLAETAKDAIESPSGARDWGREAIRLVVEHGLSVEGVIARTKDSLAWHDKAGLLDSDAKRSKFNNYFSTIRYLVEGWASGAIPLSKRDEVLRDEVSFLYVYAFHKKLEKEDASNLKDALERVARLRAFAENASPATALRLKQEVAALLEALERKASTQP